VKPTYLILSLTLLAELACVGADRTNTYPIDLPTALRLAGAQNLDIQIARERLAEAKALQASSLWQFFPSLSPGITYRQHDDTIQDVAGNIIDVHKYSYAPGAMIAAQVDLGDAWYKSLTAKQVANAANHALDAQRQEAVLAAAHGYFDISLARAAIGVAAESVRISADYDQQLQNAVGAGLAFKGDQLRVRVQLERSQLALRVAEEQQRLASARLAQVLRLDPTVELTPEDATLAPLTLMDTNIALAPLVQQALSSRPELKQNQALVAASRETKKGAVYGPLIPSLGAQAFFGGLGGGRRGVSDEFGVQEDYMVGLSWRVGPGGMFDFNRVDAAASRLRIAELSGQKVEDEITRQVIDAFTKFQSLSDQLTVAQRVLAVAEEGLNLARQRREFAVGVVLETIQSEQDLTRARLDYLKAVAEFNKAQYSLSKATGKL
jgi:outer membrane protein TolC